MRKVLINSKAGVEHLCEKLADVKIEGIPNIMVTDDTLVEALVQCDQKIEQLYNQVKNDPMYEEAIQKIKGVIKDEEVGDPSNEAPRRPGSAVRGGQSMLIAPSILRQTGYGASGFGAGLIDQQTGGGQNIRVRLQNRDEDDDLSNEENDVELEVDESERARIKMEAMKKQRSHQNSSAKKKN